MLISLWLPVGRCANGRRQYFRNLRKFPSPRIHGTRAGGARGLEPSGGQAVYSRVMKSQFSARSAAAESALWASALGALPATARAASQGPESAMGAWILLAASVLILFVVLLIHSRSKLNTIGIFLSRRGELAASPKAAPRREIVIAEPHYARVFEELRAGNIRPGLWAQAFSMADGIGRRQKAIYIRLRAEQVAAGAEPAPPAALPDKRYKVVFRGEVRDGWEPALVKRNLAELLGVSLVRVDALFSGDKQLVRAGLDIREAARQHAAITQRGGVCHVLPMYGQSSPRRLS